MGYREQVIADGATAYWRLEELSGSSAATEVGANTGTISGGVTLNQGGVAGGKAMAFNGSTGKIAVGTLALGPAAYSVEAWIKVIGTAQIPFFSNRESGAGTTAVFGVDSVSGRVFVYIGSFIYGTTSLWDGRWHHAVVTHDGSTTRIYVDGVLESQTASAIPNGTGIASIGCDVNVVFWNGSIDEVAVYPIALTAAQIANHYQLGLPKTYRDAVLMDGAIGYWKLEETSGTSAASEVGGYTGTITGGVTLNQGGIAGGKAMRFNGTNGYITMGDVAAFEFTGTFTLEAWVRISTLGNFILSKSLSSTAGYFLGVTGSGAFQFFAATGAAAQIFSTTTPLAYNDGRLHHVVGTWDGTTNANGVKLYVDGVRVVQTTAGAGTPAQNAAPFLIGAWDTTPALFFGGVIDDVAIYSSALTAAQIAAHYQLGLPQTFAAAVLFDDPVAYWRLEEPSGSSAFSEVNGYTGTLSGSGVTMNQSGAVAGGKSMLWDGLNGFIDVGDQAALEFGPGTVTFEFWGKFTDKTAQRIVMGKSDWAATYKGWTVFQNQPSQGGFRVYVRDASATVICDVFTNFEYNDGRWHHVVITIPASWTPSGVKFYVDGVSVPFTVNGGAGGTADTTNTKPLRLGGSSNGVSATYTWNGNLDEMVIYGSVLTAAQVAQHFNLAAGGPGGAGSEFRSRYRWRDAA